jgi:hypothetical protein
MKTPLFVALVIILLFVNPYGAYGNAAVTLWIWYVVQLAVNSQYRIAFREFILVLYGMNYLLAPAISFHDESQINSLYSMKISEEDYFWIAIPAMLCLQAGLYSIKTDIFNRRFSLTNIQASLNATVLKTWLFVGIACTYLQSFLPGELAFFLFLISGVRYVAVFGLFILDRKRYKWYLYGILVLEIVNSVRQAMFHDMVMWLIFFAIFLSFYLKLKLWHKMSLGALAVVLFFILQITKNDYRQSTWWGEKELGIGTFQEIATQNVEEGLFTDANVSGAVSRVNQAWIFASTMERMNRVKDFQGLHLIGIYTEAAILPRFIAPNKITAGNKEVFNKFSGHFINRSTSMGLGVFADGYIAFGYWGTLIFAFVLGLVFAMIFKTIESWSTISPLFVFFVFPLLHYAIRPDCETQTIMGHIVKGLLIFGAIMLYYRKYFGKRLAAMNKKEQIAKQKVIATSAPSW